MGLCISSSSVWCSHALQFTMGVMFQINEADGAFYGPKIDISVSDALNRKFQCATLQVNLLLPCIFFFFPDFVRASLITIIYYRLEKSCFNLLDAT